jgi:hypothetical protein
VTEPLPLRVLAFLSDPAMASALNELGLLPRNVTIATDYASAIRVLRMRPFDRLILAAPGGHSPRYPNGHDMARDAGEIIEYVLSDVPIEYRPVAVTVVNAGADYFAHMHRLLRDARIACELVEVLC